MPINWPARIRRLRRANDWTQKALAVRLEIATRTVSRWETGETSPRGLVKTRLESIRMAKGTRVPLTVDSECPKCKGKGFIRVALHLAQRWPAYIQAPCECLKPDLGP
jgi:transcriptional regulator with XRE-family HTH domain